MPAGAPKHAAERYVADVLAGRVIVGRLVRLAVERHERDLREQDERGLYFNRSRAVRACWWIEHRLRFSKGEWAKRPFVLEPWQAFIVWALFGWERIVDGKQVRRFRTAYVSVARKNGKSELGAAVALLMLITGGASVAGPEIGAEVYSAATTRDQATIVWRAAASIVRKSPELSREVDVHDSRYNLSHAKTESRFEALAADADTLDGLGPYCCIVDELHAHPDSTVWDVLASGTGSRREPLMLAITTAGAEREGVCWDVESDCVKILEQVLSKKAKAALEKDLVEEFIAQLKDIDMSKISLDIKSADVVTAHPIGEAELKRITEIVKAKIGREITIQGRTDGEHISGVVIQFGSLHLDGSLKTAIKEAALALKAEVEKGFLRM